MVIPKSRKTDAMLASAEDTSGVHVWLVLWKAFFALSNHAERSVNTLGLGQSEFRVLEVLLAKGPQPVNVIGPKVHLTPGSISVAVDRLVRKGLVRRHEEPGDRRVRRVELTDKGRAIIVSRFQNHRDAMETASKGLTTAERVTLIRLLKKLGKGAETRSVAAQEVDEERTP